MDIIFLNGSSSSGKSAIARELQHQLDGCYLHIGIDTFIGMMPSKLNRLSDGEGQSEGFYFEDCLVDGNPAYRVRSGPTGRAINHAYRDTVRLLASLGLGVLVDDVIDGAAEWENWEDALSGYSVLKVGVYCDEEILRHREAERGDRRIGSAIEQARRVHQGMRYDVTVDTSHCSPLACAHVIMRRITDT